MNLRFTTVVFVLLSFASTPSVVAAGWKFGTGRNELENSITSIAWIPEISTIKDPGPLDLPDLLRGFANETKLQVICDGQKRLFLRIDRKGVKPGDFGGAALTISYRGDDEEVKQETWAIDVSNTALIRVGEGNKELVKKLSGWKYFVLRYSLSNGVQVTAKFHVVEDTQNLYRVMSACGV